MKQKRNKKYACAARPAPCAAPHRGSSRCRGEEWRLPLGIGDEGREGGKGRRRGGNGRGGEREVAVRRAGGGEKPGEELRKGGECEREVSSLPFEHPVWLILIDL